MFEFEAELVRWINSLVGLNPVLDELVMKAHELFTVKMLPRSGAFSAVIRP